MLESLKYDANSASLFPIKLVKLGYAGERRQVKRQISQDRLNAFYISKNKENASYYSSISILKKICTSLTQKLELTRSYGRAYA